MNKIFDCADEYIQARNWKMVATLKFCLGAIGVLLGLMVPGKKKKTAAVGALAVFLVTYLPLMADFLGFAAEFFQSRIEN